MLFDDEEKTQQECVSHFHFITFGVEAVMSGIFAQVRNIVFECSFEQRQKKTYKISIHMH